MSASLRPLAANAAHGIGHGLVGAVIAAWPAVALVGTYELLMLIIRRTGPTPGEELEALNVSTAVPITRVSPKPVPAVPDPDPYQARAAEAFADELAAGTVPSVRAIRAGLRVGQPRAQNIRSHLSALVAAQATQRP